MNALAQRLANWFWRKPKRKNVGPFVEGMTLAPGESAALKLPQKVRAAIAEAQARGESVEIVQGERVETSPRCYESRVEFVAGGKVLAVTRLKYKG
jgi:hypothetical protein